MAPLSSQAPTIPIQALTSLRGKRALITGAGSGIGLAIARRFAEAGAGLVLVDIDGTCLEKARSSISGISGDVLTRVVDLSRKEDIDALWNDLHDPAPDILVNNAGVYPLKHFLDLDESFYRHIMETNLFSVQWMCQHMIRRRLKHGGVIINIASVEAVLAFKQDLSHYSVSKAGVMALTRALAREHARDGFRVNAILPGGIVTPGTKAIAKDVARLNLGLLKTGYDFRQRLPAGRAGQPDEVARMALVLASDLSSYVQGATIPVDGGFLAV